MDRSERARTSLDAIESTIERIFCRSIAEYSFQNLYDAVFFLVQSGFGSALAERVSSKLTAKAIAAHAVVTEVIQEHLVASLCDTWRGYILSVSQASDFLLFFNRHYCMHLKRPSVREMGCTAFIERVLTPDLLTRVSDAFGNQIGQHLMGLTPSTSLGGGWTTVLELSNILHGLKPAAFEAHLFQPYLHSVTVSMVGLANRKATELSLAAFVEEYTEVIRDQQQLCHSTVGERGWPRVESALQNIWLIKNRHVLSLSTLAPLLERCCGISDSQELAHHHETARLVFTTFAAVGEEDTVINIIKDFLAKEITQSSGAGSVSAWMLRSMEVLGMVQRIVKDDVASSRSGAVTSLVCSKQRWESLYKAFEDAFNRSAEVSEALASYLDSEGRLAAMSAAGDWREFEVLCDRVVLLYKFLRDKDLFEASYKQLLARRLLHVTVASGGGSTTTTAMEALEERERLFASRLLREVGGSMLCRVEGMLADCRAFEESQQRYFTYQRDNETTTDHPKVDLSVLILTSGLWPSFPPCSITLPPILEASVAAYKAYFFQRHNTRRLEFIATQGVCEVRIHFVNANRRVDVAMPTFCVPVLLLFQDAASRSVADIVTHMRCLESDVAQVVDILTRGGGSTHAPLIVASHAVSGEVAYAWNEDFKSKSMKIRLNAAVSGGERRTTGESTAGPPVSGNRDRAESDRHFRIDAALVRIMKSRRTAEHTALVNEAISAVAGSFVPSKDDVKRRIEHLITREFIARISDRQGWYSYIS